MNERETSLWIENVSDDAISVFFNHKEPYWRSMFYRKLSEMDPAFLVPAETRLACRQRIKEKVAALPKEYTYARIIVNAVIK